MDIVTLLIVLFSTAISALLSAMSGGGAAIISLPVFLWAGIPLPLSIATHKISSIFWTPVSARNYLEGRKIDWRFLAIFAMLGLIGVYFGVKVVTSIDKDVLSRVIGGIILLIIVYTFFEKNLGLKEKKIISLKKEILSYPAAIIMGFYESILGSGNGIIFAALTFHAKGFDFIDALGHYFAIAFIWGIFSSLLFVSQGEFNIGVMLMAIMGSIIGSYFGSKYAKFKGNRFIKNLFLAIGTLLAIKLLIF
jgi:uncharacterized membrane protein YfcA